MQEIHKYTNKKMNVKKIESCVLILRLDAKNGILNKLRKVCLKFPAPENRIYD